MKRTKPMTEGEFLDDRAFRWFRNAALVVLLVVAVLVGITLLPTCGNGGIPRLYCMEGEE